MKIKKYCIILLAIMLILLPLSFAAEGDYTIPSVIKDITVNDDGSTVITEEIVYDIEGSVNGVYREIPLTGNQSVRNISVKTPGYYNKLEINRYPNSTQIKVWLYTDYAKTKKTKDAKVSVTYKYTIRKGVKIYNDVADFQYMTWGDNWESKVDHMESTIHIPGSKDNTEYYNNPEDNVVSSQWTNSNTLTTKLNNIGSHTSFEQRILMPTSYFKNTTFAQVIPMDAKDLIIEDQRKYKEEHETQKTITSIFETIISILILSPLAIYVIYGREPKIDYDNKYEYDLPTDATPVQVNSIVYDDAGSITDHALYATILDLIDRKYFKIMVNDATNTIIRQTDKNTNDLKVHEKSIIEFLSSFAEDGDISISFVGRRSHRQQYLNFKQKWKSEALEETPDEWIKQYFDNKGSKILMYMSGMFILLIIATMIILYLNLLPSIAELLFISILIFMFEAIILFLLPNTFAGRWTPEGKEFHDKWKSFERYIKDYSLIEERPPSSVQVWGKYIVYASALGCAKYATSNMKKYFQSLEIEDSIDLDSTASFVYYNGFSHIESSFNSLSQSDSSDSGSGIGSSGGGGFGGGGGGTF